MIIVIFYWIIIYIEDYQTCIDNTVHVLYIIMSVSGAPAINV